MADIRVQQRSLAPRKTKVAAVAPLAGCILLTLIRRSILQTVERYHESKTKWLTKVKRAGYVCIDGCIARGEGWTPRGNCFSFAIGKYVSTPSTDVSMVTAARRYARTTEVGAICSDLRLVYQAKMSICSFSFSLQRATRSYRGGSGNALIGTSPTVSLCAGLPTSGSLSFVLPITLQRVVTHTTHTTNIHRAVDGGRR